MNLSTSQKKQLKKLGHHLNPVVIIADQGLKDTVIAATNEALAHHELIKVKVKGDRETLKMTIARLCELTDAEMVSSIGFTALLFRKNPQDPKIELS